MLAGSLAIDKNNKYHLILYRTKKAKEKKTNIYRIKKQNPDGTQEHLGIIKWHGAYRQYVFIPDNGTFWSMGCIDIVSKFLKDKNNRHRQKWKNHSK